ncbi:chloride channel protein [Fibrobacter sp. UWB12]|uniref:chloride channel protein n=1 Tax=Fibrobacter sp. UWB12 TaxID=1896203 RepID=UPI0009233CD4|nr:chloride channel protein [Fibrobacter sp. UWB12]SHK42937.1 H+/Cl-antiporter ClcA [Fibrobacter sp. UWB12]
MNFSDFSKASQQFNQFSPEMKEQMMKMAKARIKEKITKWLATPTFVVIGITLGAIIGALTACFGDISDKLTAIREANPLYFIPALALGGAAIAFAYKNWGRWTERGMDQVFAIGLNKETDFPLVAIPMAAVSTWITQLFGGSAGREGAAMQIGSALSYNISKKLPFENAAHIMLVTGMAAGFAGIFQAPMAATAFALEVLLVGHLELTALLPAAAAAFTACKVSSMLGFHKFSVDLNSLLDASGFSASIFTNEGTLDGNLLLKLALMGVLFGIVGGGFAKLLGLSQNFFAKKFPNNIKRIAIMGVGISALLLVFFQGRYAGLGTNLLDMCFGVNADLIGNAAGDAANAAGDAANVVGTAAGNADLIGNVAGYDWIIKFALTILTLSAGFIGGVVTPLFAIGATFGIFIASMFGMPVALAAALGFAAVFASASNTLWAPILIAGEIFGFDCLPAFFIVCTMAYMCNGGQSIYKQKKIRIKI